MSQDAANLPTRNESSNANPNSTVPLLSTRVDAPPGVNDSNPSMNSITGSISEQFLSMSVPSTPQHQSLTRQLTELDKRDQEDMNRWMQRQQEFTQNNLGNHQSMHYYPSVGQDSWTNTGISDLSQDDSLSTQRVAAMARPAFQLADAQVQDLLSLKIKFMFRLRPKLENNQYLFSIFDCKISKKYLTNNCFRVGK